MFSGEMDPKERLARQRKLLQKKLGLDMGAAIGMDTEDLFNDEDLDYTCQPSGPRAQGSKATAGSSSRNHVVGLILTSLALCTLCCLLYWHLITTVGLIGAYLSSVVTAS